MKKALLIASLWLVDTSVFGAITFKSTVCVKKDALAEEHVFYNLSRQGIVIGLERILFTPFYVVSFARPDTASMMELRYTADSLTEGPCLDEEKTK